MTLLVEHDWMECRTWPVMVVPSAVWFLRTSSVESLSRYFLYTFVPRARLQFHATPGHVMSWYSNDFF